jgi:hypothetical protein
MTEESTGYNSTFAIGGVSCSANSFVLRMNICGEKPAHRQSAKRYSGKFKNDNDKKQ